MNSKVWNNLFFFFWEKFIQNANVAVKYCFRINWFIRKVNETTSQDEIIFLREELKNENDLIRFVLDQLLKHDGIVCSNTECPSYRKSANDSILSTNEQKNHNKSGEIHTDEENLNYNVLLHQEIIEFSKSNIRVSKSSAKQGKPIERREQNTEFVSTSKQRRGQSQIIKKSVIILEIVWWNI